MRGKTSKQAKRARKKANAYGAKLEFQRRLAEHWLPTILAATENHATHTLRRLRNADCLHCNPGLTNEFQFATLFE
jgi:hypothetical protein